MKAQTLVLGALFASFSIAAHGQSERLDFKGMRMGDALAQLDASLGCLPDSTRGHDYTCVYRDRRNNTYAGEPVKGGPLFQLFGDQLDAVQLTFGPASYSRLKRALDEKFGPVDAQGRDRLSEYFRGGDWVELRRFTNGDVLLQYFSGDGQRERERRAASGEARSKADM